MLRFIVEHSPIRRRDIIAAARQLGFVEDSPRGRHSYYMTLRALRSDNCIVFDEEIAEWTGRAPAFKGISSSARSRFVRIAAGDKEKFTALYAAEILRRQAKADSDLAALRPAHLPVINSDDFPPWRPQRPLEVTPAARAILAAYASSPAVRAVASKYR